MNTVSLNIIDLYAGKGGEQRRKDIEARGHKLTTVDIESKFGCTMTRDIMKTDDLGLYDFGWASVPCETWSVAAIGKNWRKTETGYEPKTEKAEYMIHLVKHTIDLLQESTRYGWVIENPMGMLRVMPFMKDIRRQTVTYCQYGENRMKPTDLWICGFTWKTRPMCHKGDPCHESAPRGSRRGTQRIKGAVDRSIVPLALWMECLDAMESYVNDYIKMDEQHG